MEETQVENHLDLRTAGILDEWLGQILPGGLHIVFDARRWLKWEFEAGLQQRGREFRVWLGREEQFEVAVALGVDQLRLDLGQLHDAQVYVLQEEPGAAAHACLQFFNCSYGLPAS